MRSDSFRIADRFTSEKEFVDLLKSAESNAESELEENFVADIQEKFEKWGTSMFISDKQIDWLEKLGER